MCSFHLSCECVEVPSAPSSLYRHRWDTTRNRSRKVRLICSRSCPSSTDSNCSLSQGMRTWHEHALFGCYTTHHAGYLPCKELHPIFLDYRFYFVGEYHVRARVCTSEVSFQARTARLLHPHVPTIHLAADCSTQLPHFPFFSRSNTNLCSR